MKFSNKALTFWRQNKCVTKTKLAKAIGITVEKLEAYETGTQKPTAKTVNKIAIALNVQPMFLTDLAEKHKYEHLEIMAMNVAAFVYQARIEKGLTRTELAKLAGCSTAVIQTLEANKTARPRWENICKLAMVLDIPREKLQFS